jgi:L-iditol 2-dehydrogenase
MKAAVYLGPGRIDVQEVPTPQCHEGEVLLKIDACAVCGTDLRIYQHGHHAVTPPHITGHEVSATVAEVGKGVMACQVGDRVTVVTEIGCGQCDWCRRGRQNMCPDVSQNLSAIGYRYPGAFAEYMVMPAEGVRQGNILKVSSELPAEQVCLVEPLSCVINGQSYLKIVPGETVLVIGSGPIGCMHVAMAKVQGAAKVILADISQSRLRLAEGVSPEVTVNSAEEDLVQRVMDETKGKGADVVIVACSVPAAQEQALKLVGIQGRISFFGGLPKNKAVIGFDSNVVHYKEVSVFGAFASYSYQYLQALALLESGKVQASRFITHRFPLSDIVQGFETAIRGDALKVVIQP